MGIKVGETITACLKVDIQYYCSSCGKENLNTGTIKETAHTSTIMGFNLDNNLRGTAHKALSNKIDAVLDQENPHRFKIAGISCSCRNCGYTEPWAKMNYEHLQKPKTILSSILMLSAFFSLFGLKDQPISAAFFVFLAIAVLSATALIGINTYISKNNEKQEKLIAALPQQSIPIFLTHSEARHTAFYKKLSSGISSQQPVPNQSVPTHPLSAGESQYDTWICKECRTQNSLKYSQCKTCGKFRSR
jgi:hypothetical protein